MALRSHPQMTGTQFVAGNGTERRIKLKYNYMITCDWKAEMNLRTPKTLRVEGTSPPATHFKDASRRRSKPKGDALQRRFASQEQA